MVVHGGGGKLWEGDETCGQIVNDVFSELRHIKNVNYSDNVDRYNKLMTFTVSIYPTRVGTYSIYVEVCHVNGAASSEYGADATAGARM